MNKLILIDIYLSFKEIEQSLLKIYSEKFHKQEELEFKYLDEVRSLFKLNQKFSKTRFFSIIKT